MFSRRLQQRGIYKKKFQMDVDSSDDESTDLSQATHPYSIRKLSSQSNSYKRPLVYEELHAETDDEQDLEDLYNPLKKRIHKETDDYALHMDQNCQRRIKSFQKKHFWTIFESEMESPSIKYEHKDNDEGYTEENASSEHQSDVNREDFSKEREGNDKVVYSLEDYFNLRDFAPELCEEEEGAEDQSLVKDVKAYLKDSDTDEKAPNMVITLEGKTDY